MTTVPARLLLLLVAVLAVGSFSYSCFRYIRGENFHDYGYFLFQAAILDRFGSPWDPAARAAAEQTFHFPHTISVAHYLPAFFILLIPFSRMDYAASALLWCGASLAALLFILVALWRWFFRARQPYFGAIFLLLLLGWFHPLLFNIGAGQNNLLALGLIVLGTELLARRRPWLAGFPLALAALLKIVPLVLLAPLLLRREWRGLTAMLAWFLALNLLTLAWLPYTAFSDFAGAVAEKMRTDAHCILSFSVHSLAWRLTNSKAVAGVVQNLAFLAAVAGAGWLTLKRRAAGSAGWPELMALWSVVFLIGSAFLGEAHLVFALPALALAAAALLDGERLPLLPALVFAAALALLGLEYHPDGLLPYLNWPFTIVVNLKLLGLLLLAGLLARPAAR